ncbi:MAG: hypothetical protein ACMXYD_04740 [Candidatus Woesearchaeota archaeon]
MLEMKLEVSWVLFVIAGFFIILGLPTGWTANFWYWAFPRTLYIIGVIYFWREH